MSGQQKCSGLPRFVVDLAQEIGKEQCEQSKFISYIMKKITRTTIKSFIKKNFDDLYISSRSRFNGMIECVDKCHDQEFYKVEEDNRERFNDSYISFN